jgi:MerR family transcriptional regulator, light-induced transcriptional regulator
MIKPIREMNMPADQLGKTLEDIQKKYLEAIRTSDSGEADCLLKSALEQSIAPADIYLQIFQPSAYEIGWLWEAHQISVGQEHVASAIIERHMGELHLRFKSDHPRQKKLILGCVDREYHRIGLRMVADFFEMDGWEVCYLGAAVPADAFARMVKEYQPDLIGISVEVDYHLPRLVELQIELKREGIHPIPIMAGGLPFIRNPKLAGELGLAFSASDAREAVIKANQLFPPGKIL